MTTAGDAVFLTPSSRESEGILKFDEPWTACIDVEFNTPIADRSEENVTVDMIATLVSILVDLSVSLDKGTICYC